MLSETLQSLALRSFALMVYLRRWWISKIGVIDHPKIIQQSAEEGHFTAHYSFLVVVAAGIATIGLLLNSPAVIIGAMLLSPLMGPIVLTGLSLATVNLDLGKAGFFSLAAGVGIALLVAIIIVFFSPLTDATPEIIARTRPNLFDLVVALLSGLAGSYALIRGKGGTVVGVAIATALMPPIAVVGYGIALWQWEIARGAFLLFITNMVAISIGVAFIATLYGFGRRPMREELLRNVGFALLVLIPLSIPLFSSLRSIASETLATRAVRQVLEEQNGFGKQSDITALSITNNSDGPMQVRAIITLPERVDGLQERSRLALEKRLGREVQLNLSQLEWGDKKKSLSAVANPLQETLNARTRQVALVNEFVRGFPLPVKMVETDHDQRRIVIMPQPAKGLTIELLYRMEHEWRNKLEGWQVILIPPTQSLPLLRFARKEKTLAEDEMQRLDTILWALQRWEVNQVELIGHASASGEASKRLASARADHVKELFEKRGVTIISREGVYPAPNQSSIEKESGVKLYRSVEIRLPSAITTVTTQTI